MHCASTCGIYEGCTFLAINSKTLECHVFKEDGTTWSTERKIDHGWLYYEEYNLQIQFLIDSLVCGTDGYVTIDSHCFKVHEEERSYGNASAICFLEGGRMAVTDNAATFLALNDYIREHHGGMVGYLLGLTDRAVEGEWRWENGNLIGTVPEFNGNQPNGNDRRYNDFTADCAYASVVWHDLHKAIDKLYDDNCDHPATFVCERVIV
ncbi:C-type lectin domain family 17, member A-like [Argopecten irradians]|uniref:C-type lectin domain family 17, member A-like n=1 Tax=Argopecten irradians TaxID=31199 RepID=UPI00371A1D6B